MAATSSDCSMDTLIPFSEPLSKSHLMEVAKVELNETEEIREECMKQLKALITEHNVCSITSDDFLLRFLRTRKFQVQRSFEALQNYAKQRAALHDMFSNLRQEVLEFCIRNTIYGILPYRDYEGRLIVFSRSGNWNESMCTAEECLACYFTLLCFVAEDESAQIKGILFLADEDNFTLHNAMIAVRLLGVVKRFLFNGLPIRYKCVHIMNEPWHYRIFYALLAPFLPKKLKNRFALHGKNKDALSQIIPPCVLPTECESSTNDPFFNDQLIGMLSDYSRKLKEEQRYFLPDQ